MIVFRKSNQPFHVQNSSEHHRFRRSFAIVNFFSYDRIMSQPWIISTKRKCTVQIFETCCTYLPTCCLNSERSPSVGLTLVQPRKWSVDSEDRSRTHAKLVERAKMPAFHKPYSMSKQKLLGVSIKIWLLGWTIILFNLHIRTHASHR